MTPEEIEALESEEALLYMLWHDGEPVDRIAKSLGLDELSVKRKISRAILKIELRRKIGEQDRRLSWP